MNFCTTCFTCKYASNISNENLHYSGNLVHRPQYFVLCFYRDAYNDWVQVGDSTNELCTHHNKVYGAPVWGRTAGSASSTKGNIYCCRKLMQLIIYMAAEKHPFLFFIFLFAKF